MASPRQFSKRIRKIAQNIPRNTDNLVQKVAIVVDQVVVSETPVDTGRARSNWLVQLGSPASGTIEAYAPGEQGSTAAQNTQAALDQGEAVIKGYRGGVEIHITNNLPYIQPLNEGSSPQAPPDFVQGAIRAGLLAVQYGGKIVDP